MLYKVLTHIHEKFNFTGETLNFESDAVYAFRQSHGLPATGGVTIQGPDVALQPVAFISGSPKLPSCGDVQLNGRKSVGGGGRSMTFEWSVSSSGDTTNVTQALAVINSKSI